MQLRGDMGHLWGPSEEKVSKKEATKYLKMGGSPDGDPFHA